MNRDIKEIITPIDKHKVEIKAWLIGREKRAITSLFLDEASIGEEGKSKVNLSSGIVNKAQDIAFETVVVSINGKKENILDTILDMKGTDFDFVVTEINKITGGTEDEEVKKK